MSETFVKITQVQEQGMITLRMELSDEAACSAVQAALGLDVPEPHGVTASGDRGLIWMSKDELMILCPMGAVAALLTDVQAALADVHHLLADVSNARAVFDLKGKMLRDVLAKLTPADMHPDAFPIGYVRRTRLGQVPAAIWLPAKDSARVICFRSVGDYMDDLLHRAAQKGAEVA